MKQDFINRISTLRPFVFLDKSKEMITIHFISDDGLKPDIIAYMLANKSWDVREITSETSTLLSDKEVIEVLHSPIGLYEPDSEFDVIAKRCIEASHLNQSKDTFSEELLNFKTDNKLN